MLHRGFMTQSSVHLLASPFNSVHCATALCKRLQSNSKQACSSRELPWTELVFPCSCVIPRRQAFVKSPELSNRMTYGIGPIFWPNPVHNQLLHRRPSLHPCTVVHPCTIVHPCTLVPSSILAPSSILTVVHPSTIIHPSTVVHPSTVASL